MVIIGETKKMIMGGWILAALIVLAYNASQFATLLAPPIAGYPQEVRSVIGKRYQLDVQVAGTRQSMTPIDFTRLTAVLDRPPANKEREPAGPVESAESAADVTASTAEAPLPRLQGIFRSSDIRGRLKRRAMLDGKLCGEKDRFGIFTVQQISDKGVTLTNDRGSWFLKSPDISFSFAREE